MKLREVNFDKFVTSSGVKIKPYLSWEEMKDTYLMIKSQDGGFMRHFAKVVEVTKYCTDLDLEGLENDEIFTLANSLGLPYEYSLEVCGYDELDKMIKDDESVYNLMSDILPKLEGMVSGMNFDGVMSQLENMKGVVDVVNNK